MATRDRRRDRGARRAAATLRTLADELRAARLGSGLTLREVAASSGISRAQLARLERGDAPGASLRSLSIAFAVLGMRLNARPYPEGLPLRDEAQASLLARFRSELPPGISMRTEVPLHGDRDLRAWDAELATADATCKLEAESALYDLQAQERRIALKMADDDAGVVILLVADTHRNRRVLREFRDLIAVRFPLDTRAVMAALRAGRLPERSGLVLR
jgi:transcriptional regulator with XRE-family HTH domain